MRYPKRKPVWLQRGWSTPRICFAPSKEAWDWVCRYYDLGAEPYPATRDAHTMCADRERGTIVPRIIMVTVGEHIDKKRDKVAVLALLAHEAVHVKQFVMEHAGEDKPGIEMEAYCVQFIFEQLVHAYVGSRRRLFT